MNFTNIKTGITFGVIGFFLYIFLLFLRYTYFSSTAAMFGMSSIFSFFIIIGLLVVAALKRKSELGGVTQIKDLFQTVFVVIIITELGFALFNHIYLSYINPTFLNEYMVRTLDEMRTMNVPDDTLVMFEETLALQKEVGWSSVILGWARAVVVDGIFGLIIAVIVHKTSKNN